MEHIGKHLLSLVTSSPMKQEKGSLQQALDDRLTLSEAIEAATQIIGAYPNGGANAGPGYIGALSAMLGSYPKSVALKCADPALGVVRDCKFLPTAADIVAWCERAVAPLYAQQNAHNLRKQQLREREEFLQREQVERPTRLSIDELKEKYGDWQTGWRRPGELAAELRQKAEDQLVGEIGRAAFDALPDA